MQMNKFHQSQNKYHTATRWETQRLFGRSIIRQYRTRLQLGGGLEPDFVLILLLDQALYDVVSTQTMEQ